MLIKRLLHENPIQYMLSPKFQIHTQYMFEQWYLLVPSLSTKYVYPTLYELHPDCVIPHAMVHATPVSLGHILVTPGTQTRLTRDLAGGR